MATGAAQNGKDAHNGRALPRQAARGGGGAMKGACTGAAHANGQRTRIFNEYQKNTKRKQ